MSFRNGLLSFLIVFLTQTGSIRPNPAQSPSASEPPALQTLQAGLEAGFSDPRLARAQICVEVMSLDRSEVLYEKNPRQLFTPASVNKLITAAAALVRLGPEFRFETRVFTDGPIRNGALEGNLIIVGSGDPSFAPRFHEGDPFAVFSSWASLLKDRNIRSISGRILGDDTAFRTPGLGYGWEWNDLPQSYAARVSALQFNENVISVQASLDPEKSGQAFIRTSPLEDYLAISNRIGMEPEKARREMRVDFANAAEAIEVYGPIPAQGETMAQNVPVQRPAHYFLAAFERTLARQGIRTNSYDMAKSGDYASPPFSLAWKTASPPLPEILKPLLKKSQNLYAETLARTLGLVFRGEGSFAKGKEIVEEALAGMGIPVGTYAYADGSGLSRQNLASADSLVRLLQYMRQQPSFEIFYGALPVAGIDGTLSERMKKGRTKNNVHAKTGSMANVSSISGYVRTADGELLAFSISINNSMATRDVVEAVQDRAIEMLADFSRDK